MTGATLRDLSYETTDDKRACVLMVIGQLLKRHGLIERADIDTLNTLVGREPGEPTSDVEIAELLFGAGFIELAYQEFDIERALVDFEYWVGCVSVLSKVERDSTELLETWHYWKQFGELNLELRRRFADQLIVIPRNSTSLDLDERLAGGYDVVTMVELNPEGWGIAGLVLSGNASDGYECYNPVTGIVHRTAAELFPTGFSQFSAVKLPDGSSGVPVTLPS